MKLILQLLISFALVWLCEAGVKAHEPQTLQTAVNLFNWLSARLGNVSGNVTQTSQIQYHENVVTKCPPNVMFVLDGSDSVSAIGFTYAKSALVREIRSLIKYYSDVHMGVILFGSTTQELVIKARTANEIESLIQQVTDLKQPNTITAISSAVRRARQILLDYSKYRSYSGDKSGNIIVLLSDGHTDGNTNFDIRRATIQEAKIAKDGDILLISLSPEEADVQFLQDISHVVQEYRTDISWPSLVACPGCRDIVFVVDVSDSLLQREDIIRQYLAYTALRYRLLTNAIGVNVYGTDPYIHLNETRIMPEEDKYKLAETIRQTLKFPKSGGTRSDTSISESVNMLNNYTRRRPSTLVYITYGPPTDLQTTRQAIQTARVRGYPVIIIRVGTALSDEDLNTLSGGLTGDVYSVNSFTDLYSVDFDQSVCKAACFDSCPPNKTQDINCSCVCHDKCPTGQLQDANCNCYCPANNCPSDQCNCVCPKKCTPGQTQDSNCNCKCPSISCPSGQIQDSNCNCKCPSISCPSGQIQDSNCNCKCPSISCPSGQIQDSNCNCKCPNISCPSGQIQDSNCNCKCPNINCPSGQLLDNCTCLPCSVTCPSGQFVNNSCQCICYTTLLPPTSNCGCALPCPSLSVYNNTSCVCDKVITLNECNQSEYKCDNNQVAYKYSNGQCACACNSSFAGSRCEINLNSDLCKDCYFENGHYHNGIAGQCDLYVNCIPNGVTSTNQTRPVSFIPIITSCPLGTYYITRPDGWRGCDFLTNGVCTSDKCPYLLPNYKYADSTECQSYWQCGADKQLLSKECCNEGKAFDEKSQTCVTNESCQPSCKLQVSTGGGGGSVTSSTCPYAITINNPNEFFYKQVPWAKLKCPSNQIMDLTVCRCVVSYISRSGCDPTVDINFETNSYSEEDNVPRIQISGIGQVGYFSGNQDLILKSFAGSGFYTDYFQINLKLYLPTTPSGSQRIAVVTNADCNKKESVSITLDNKNFYFKIFQIDIDEAAEISIPYSGLSDSKGWFDITLIYQKVGKTFEFTGKIGSVSQKYLSNVSLKDYIDIRNCALHVGHGFNYSSLVGYVDNFQVWRLKALCPDSHKKTLLFYNHKHM
ncbi:hypothetical protein Btru_074529 [Bulinus truncatus]|nr:hypothetical protein Btru_074529 [Bulinus truncatus]